jgi:hypothetical protein
MCVYTGKNIYIENIKNFIQYSLTYDTEHSK